MSRKEEEKVIQFENYFPNDILPTTKFISKLPGIDQEYAEFEGEGEVYWNGISTINGELTTIRISHVHQSTTFLLEGENRAEIWEMEERDTRTSGCYGLTFRRRKAVLPGTILNPSNTIQVLEDTHFIGLNFCKDDKDTSEGKWCSGCPFQDKELEKKATKKERMLFSDSYYDSTRFTFEKPSDLPPRRTRNVQVEKSKRWMEGFNSVNEAIDALICLRDAISSATPLLSDQSAPTPFSQSLYSDRCFK